MGGDFAGFDGDGCAGGPSFCRSSSPHSAVPFWTSPGGASFCQKFPHGLCWRFWTTPCPLLEEGIKGWCSLRIALKPIPTPTPSRLPRGNSRQRPNSPPSGGVPEGRGGRRAFPPTPKSIPAKTDASPGWSRASRLRREPSSPPPFLTLFNHRNPLHHSKIQKRASLYIKYVYYIKKICTFAAWILPNRKK